MAMSARQIADATSGLNPYCSGRWSRTVNHSAMTASQIEGLNPYCSGRWSRTNVTFASYGRIKSLNPYCSGRWSRTIMSQITVGRDGDMS